MTLGKLFESMSRATFTGSDTVAINDIALDSRKVEPGTLFVALQGEKQDGRTFIPEAIANGAVAIASEDSITHVDVPHVEVPHLRRLLGELAHRVYGEPSLGMNVIGVTGTNGKTTVTQLIESILRADGRSTGYIGTLTYRWSRSGEIITRDAERTTPEATDLHRLLKQMVGDGVTDVVLECSSIALSYGRLHGLAANVAVFTNLTPDHLDFHGDMNEYRKAKWKLFDEILADSPKDLRSAILNLDDPVGVEFFRNTSLPAISFSIHDQTAVVYALDWHTSLSGTTAKIQSGNESYDVEIPLVGEHNLSNVLAACAVANALGISAEATVRGISEVTCIPGRLEAVPNQRNISVFVDYAHTPDALLNVITALLPYRNKRLITVFGCGGDRDQGKRPMMGEVVFSHSDISIVTSDNPRTENPDAIIKQIIGDRKLSNRLLAIPDRKKAIETALENAHAEDIVLIAGKGHEAYQEVNGQKYPFDDRESVRQWFRGRSA